MCAVCCGVSDAVEAKSTSSNLVGLAQPYDALRLVSYGKIAQVRSSSLLVTQTYEVVVPPSSPSSAGLAKEHHRDGRHDEDEAQDTNYDKHG